MGGIGENTQPPIKDLHLGIGVGTGVVVWAVHLMVVYVLVALACGRGWLDSTFLGTSGLNFILFVITLVAIVLIGLAGLLSYRSWQRLPEQESNLEEGRYKRYRFMTFSGIVLSILFGVLTALSLIPSFIVPSCQ